MTVGTAEEIGRSSPRPEPEPMSHLDAKMDADRYVIGMLTQLIAFRHEDAVGLGEEIFPLLRTHGSRAYGDDPEKMRVFQERVDHYARCWRQGALK